MAMMVFCGDFDTCFPRARGFHALNDVLKQRLQSEHAKDDVPAPGMNLKPSEIQIINSLFAKTHDPVVRAVLAQLVCQADSSRTRR